MKLNESGLPFDDFRGLLGSLPQANEEICALTKEQVADRLGDDSGRIGQFCEWYSAWSGRSPIISRPVLTLFAGTHGCEPENSGPILDEVTAVAEGSAAINRLCHTGNLGLKVLDLALQIPVSDIREDAGLDEKSCAGTIAFGMEAIAGGADLLCVSCIDRGINTSSLALLSILGEGKAEDLALSLRVSENTLAGAKSAIARTEHHRDNPLELLRHLGGRDTAAICGAILAARMQHIPVVISGYTALSAALVLYAVNSSALNHCLYAQSDGSGFLFSLCSRIGLGFVLDDQYSNSPVIQLATAAGLVRSAGLVWQQDPNV